MNRTSEEKCLQELGRLAYSDPAYELANGVDFDYCCDAFCDTVGGDHESFTRYIADVLRLTVRAIRFNLRDPSTPYPYLLTFFGVPGSIFPILPEPIQLCRYLYNDFFLDRTSSVGQGYCVAEYGDYIPSPRGWHINDEIAFLLSKSNDFGAGALIGEYLPTVYVLSVADNRPDTFAPSDDWILLPIPHFKNGWTVRYGRSPNFFKKNSHLDVDRDNSFVDRVKAQSLWCESLDFSDPSILSTDSWSDVSKDIHRGLVDYYQRGKYSG